MDASGATGQPRGDSRVLAMRNRSVLELMVLILTTVIAVSIMAIGATIAIVEIRDPDVDTSAAAQSLLTLISGIVGALLGLLAGRSDVTRDLSERPEEVEEP